MPEYGSCFFIKINVTVDITMKRVYLIRKKATIRIQEDVVKYKRVWMEDEIWRGVSYLGESRG